MSEDQKVIEQQKDIFMSIILEKVPFARLNGSLKNRIYNNLKLLLDQSGLVEWSKKHHQVELPIIQQLKEKYPYPPPSPSCGGISK